MQNNEYNENSFSKLSNNMNRPNSEVTLNNNKQLNKDLAEVKTKRLEKSRSESEDRLDQILMSKISELCSVTNENKVKLGELKDGV